MRSRLAGWPAKERIPPVVALWAVAVAQPVLDLFGTNAEFFVANDLTRLEIVAFALGVVVIGPLVLLAVGLLAHLVDARAGRGVHHLTVAVLGSAVALSVAGQLDVQDGLIVLPVAVFAGVAIAYAESRYEPARTGLRYLALSPVLFLVVFLGFSPTADLLRGDPSAAVEPAPVGAPAPTVVLSFDEFPTASLLRPDGTLNDERFPNFARLAEASTWYRNATAVAATTTESVPATFTGRFPEPGQLPTYRDHPESLFTLLGTEYPQVVVEQVTELCPTAICPQEGRGFDRERVSTALEDAAAVYGHLALPSGLDDWLPVVDRSWGGFVDEGDVAASGGVFVPSDAPEVEPGEDPGARYGDEARALGPDPTCPDIELWCATARMSELIETIDADAGPTLYAAHVTTPHLPWILSAEGRQYAPRSVFVEGADASGAWLDDPTVARQAFQRHLLQVGALDLLLGRLIDRLESEGLWEEALVVVVADHGVAFTPGEPLRAPTAATTNEIYNVPLFVKAPGQVAGEGAVDDQNALTVDVLPTIVDLLEIDTDWELDGRPLGGDAPPPAEKPVYANGERSFIPVDLEDLFAVARRNRDYLPWGDDWTAVAAVGPYGDLVGRPADDLDLTGGVAAGGRVAESAVLQDWDPAGSELAPILLHGHLDAGAGAAPSDLLVAVNGTVAGVGVQVPPSADGGTDFTALIDESTLRPGLNGVAALVPTTPGGREFRFVSLGA